MDSEPGYSRYVSTRQNLYRKLDEIRAEVDGLLADLATRRPAMSEVARLEAFHAERQRLLEELQQAEESFMEHLLQQRTGPNPPEGNSP